MRIYLADLGPLQDLVGHTFRLFLPLRRHHGSFPWHTTMNEGATAFALGVMWCDVVVELAEGAGKPV